MHESLHVHQWRNYYGLGPGEPGGPQPQWGPQAQAIAYRATMPSSDHQNSVKSVPKVQDSESLDSKLFRVSMLWTH